ncbi:MAG: thiamine-phosphate kinase [Gemmatimonadaceae bacterium]|nr:thiamine-phosphate kinase [Gemmatimonadaceae bacterium]
MSAEQDLIRSFVEQWGSAASGIGDDAAILTVPPGEKLVVSTDASVEDVHFRRKHISAEEIGYRSTAAALSDLAAMAARPLGLLFALVLPESWRDEANAIAKGVGASARAVRCPIVGGNISSGETLSLTTTVLGSSENPLTRSGAKAGDSVFATGNLGGAAAAVAAWEAGRAPKSECRERFVRPSPRIEEAIWLAANGATSAIDISDGLSRDALHVAESSGVSVSIDLECVPFAACTSPEQAFEGGEDYELLVTARAFNLDEFQRRFGIPLTRIGSVVAGPAALSVKKDGKAFTPPPGFDHLSRK